MAKQAGNEDNAMKKVLKIGNSVLQLQCYRTNISFLFPLKQYIQQCICTHSKSEVFVRTGKTPEKIAKCYLQFVLDSENGDFQRNSACLGVFAW